MVSLDYHTKCSACGSNIRKDSQDDILVCKQCGHIFIDEEKSKNTRASGSTSFALHDYGLRTEIAIETKDYAGKSIDSQMAEQMNNIRKWHIRSRIVSPQERRLSNVLTKINETCAAMALPKLLVETAAMLYRNYESKQEAKGKSIACMAAATIYLACKKCQVVRSLDEIVAATGVTEQDRSSIKLASKYYRMMMMEMGSFTEQEKPVEAPQNVPVAMAIDHYISKLSNMARISTKVERLAIDIAHKTSDHMLVESKAPNGLAAAYIYMASILLGENISRRDVSNLVGATDTTIINQCKRLLSIFRLNIVVKARDVQDEILPEFFASSRHLENEEFDNIKFIIHNELARKIIYVMLSRRKRRRLYFNELYRIVGGNRAKMAEMLYKLENRGILVGQLELRKIRSQKRSKTMRAVKNYSISDAYYGSLKQSEKLISPI